MCHMLMFPTSLIVEKDVQNWVQFEGDVFKFPRGAAMFPQGVDMYIDELVEVITISDGTVRAALDTKCGVCLKHIPCEY